MAENQPSEICPIVCHPAVPASPWIVELGPRIDLTVITREPEPLEVFDVVNRRAIDGLRRAVAAAEDRAKAAELRALMATERAQAAYRGQAPVMAWVFVAGMVLGVLASVIC